MRHFNMFCSTFDTEPITFSIIAHEYFDEGYDETTYSYVYSGPSYASGATGVQEFSSGFQGAQTTIQAILNDGVDTTVEAATVTDSGAWQTLVGLYTPHNLARWVSFEFVIDHDQDNDDILPSVYVDGLLLQASQETPLLQSVKTTAEAAQSTAAAAQSDATDALEDAASNLLTIEGHTTSLENIELAQAEAAIVRTGISSEQGSLLFNAGFSETLTSSNFALAKGFWPFY